MLCDKSQQIIKKRKKKKEEPCAKAFMYGWARFHEKTQKRPSRFMHMSSTIVVSTLARSSVSLLTSTQAAIILEYRLRHAGVHKFCRYNSSAVLKSSCLWWKHTLPRKARVASWHPVRDKSRGEHEAEPVPRVSVYSVWHCWDKKKKRLLKLSH